MGSSFKRYSAVVPLLHLSFSPLSPFSFLLSSNSLSLSREKDDAKRKHRLRLRCFPSPFPSLYGNIFTIYEQSWIYKYLHENYGHGYQSQQQ
jgi:hypothetical protein